MLYRNIEKTLISWKNRSNKMPLLIKGCRQCGKTSSVVKFAKENYENVIYINFFEHPEYKDLFNGSLDVNNIIEKMSALYRFNVTDEKNTIIILDEVQMCGNARTALKFFKLDGRFDVIATGSLLGVKGAGDEINSVPVGFEEIIHMYPMSFYEFLIANEIGNNVIKKLYYCFKNVEKIDDAIHNVLRQLLLKYIIVGGMPRAVDEYVKTRNIEVVTNIQKSIISEYRDDVIKYAIKNDKMRILECFDSIPNQLSKENKKFQFSVIRKGTKSKEYANSIQWLVDAGIVVKCKNLSSIELPLDGNAANDTFKLYMQDIGLLISMFEQGTQYDILNNNLQRYKGAIFENYAADILSKMGRKLYYYKKDSGLEIDFAIRYKNECVPLEVKATNGYSKSLKTVIENKQVYKIKYGFKFGDYNMGISNNIITAPLYTLFLLDDLIYRDYDVGNIKVGNG